MGKRNSTGNVSYSTFANCFAQLTQAMSSRIGSWPNSVVDTRKANQGVHKLKGFCLFLRVRDSD
jgi:hypothetical protein